MKQRDVIKGSASVAAVWPVAAQGDGIPFPCAASVRVDIVVRRRVARSRPADAWHLGSLRP
jgi:hypothetical protein